MDGNDHAEIVDWETDGSVSHDDREPRRGRGPSRLKGSGSSCEPYALEEGTRKGAGRGGTGGASDSRFVAGLNQKEDYGGIEDWDMTAAGFICTRALPLEGMRE